MEPGNGVWSRRKAHPSPAVVSRSSRHGIHPQKAQLNPNVPGLWARVLVRALVVTAAGVMALGFLGPGEAVLVAVLTALTFVLLWLRARTLARGRATPSPERSRGTEPPRSPGED